MYLGIDVGGTKTLIALLSTEGVIEQQVKFPTSDDYQQFLKDVATNLQSLGEHSYKAGAAGVAGRLDRQTGTVIKCGNLSWQNEPLQEDLERIAGCPFVIENDAKAGGLAEAILLLDEFKNVLFVTIGTGIGLAYIANGLIDLKIIDGGGRSLMIEHEGTIQAWESFASGSAIVRQFGKKASEITDPTTWKVITHNLAIGILELLATITPDVIVIGGGVGAHFDQFGELLQQELERYQSDLLTIPPLRQAQHAEQAVIYGCYELIKQHDGKTAR